MSALLSALTGGLKGHANKVNREDDRAWQVRKAELAQKHSIDLIDHRASLDGAAYARNRQDQLEDHTRSLKEQQAMSAYQSEQARIAEERKRAQGLEDYEAKKGIDARYREPKDPHYTTDADGNYIAVNGSRAEPVMRQRSPDELRLAQRQADNDLASTVNQNAPQGIIAGQMGVGSRMPAANTPQAMQDFKDHRSDNGWFDVKAPGVDNKVPLQRQAVGDGNQTTLANINGYITTLRGQRTAIMNDFDMDDVKKRQTIADIDRRIMDAQRQADTILARGKPAEAPRAGNNVPAQPGKAPDDAEIQKLRQLGIIQ